MILVIKKTISDGKTVTIHSWAYDDNNQRLFELRSEYDCNPTLSNEKNCENAVRKLVKKYNKVIPIITSNEYYDNLERVDKWINGTGYPYSNPWELYDNDF
jgi:hypothetical protein